VSEVHTLTTRTSPGIDVELFPLFIKVENSLEISMGKEHSSSQKLMGPTPSKLLKASEKLRRNLPGTKVPDELLVIDGDNFTINHGSFDCEWIDILLLICENWCLFSRKSSSLERGGLLVLFSHRGGCPRG